MRIGIAGLGVLLCWVAVSGAGDVVSAATPQRGLVSVCHQSGTNAYRLIQVSSAALQAHIRHGDGQPGDDVPGDPTRRFDDSCTTVDQPEPEQLTHTFGGTIGGGPSGNGMCLGSGEGAVLSNYGACEFEFIAGTDGHVSAELAWAPDVSPQVMLGMVATVNGLFADQAEGTAASMPVSVPVSAGDAVRVFFFYGWRFDAVDFPDLTFEIAITVPPGSVRTKPGFG